MKNWYLVVDVEKCENCNNCFLACKDEHVDNEWPGYAAPMPGQGSSWIRIERKERGEFPFIDVAYLPVPCMHCEDAPCMKAAKDDAITRRPDGIVIIDPAKAQGQKQVVKACPYDAIQWNDVLNVPQKCTLCAHLLDEGWKKTRCVQACPTGALSLRHADDTEVNEMIQSENLETYLPERNTSPHAFHKNLYRFMRCFIGGSVALRVGDKEECAEGASVTLLNSGNEKIGECTTDHFGDFKFDNLEENSGTYTLRIVHNGHKTKSVTVELAQSVYVGTIFL
ncbi:MAG TPA: 4Fe-4S dicluster domain-containing protein [Syntrophorhabdales bacterium]|nr:4Fe-4S dicluster domain-containing protein [Syntrophorhabdales bacterium]